MTPTPIATPARQIKGILEAKYRNPKRTIQNKGKLRFKDRKRNIIL